MKFRKFLSTDMPRPVKFPAEMIYRVESYPGSVGSRSIIDLYADTTTHNELKPLPLNMIEHMISESGEGVLNYPSLISNNIIILTDQNNTPYPLDIKYYTYFFYNYPRCDFLGTSPHNPIVIKRRKIVGLVMSMVIGDIEEC